MNHKQIFCAALLVCTLAQALEPVRELKAYANGTLLTGDAWQNKTQVIRLEWKEPLAEIKEYTYVLNKGITQTTTTNTCLVTIPEGTSIIAVSATDTTGAHSPEKKLTVRYDHVAPKNTLTATYATGNIIFENIPFAEGAPVQGIVYYWGPNAQGTPDKYTTATATVLPLVPRIGETYYIRALVEDVAGNISPVATLVTISGTVAPDAPGSPNMAITERTADILGDKKELIPGAKIKYTLKLINKGTDNANALELIDAIPQGTSFVADTGTTSHPARIEYLDSKLNGGAGAWSPIVINPDTIRKVKWIFTTPFAPQETGIVSFTVQADKI